MAAGKDPRISKTMWFNTLTLIGLGLGAMIEAEAVTNPQILAWITVGIIVVNGALRLITKEPLKLTSRGRL